MKLERRRTRWSGSDRKGRTLAVFYTALTVLNFFAAGFNSAAHLWLLSVVDMTIGVIFLVIGYWMLMLGVRRQALKELDDMERRRQNWRWN